MRKKEKKRQKELERKKEEELRKLEEGSDGEGSFKIHVSCTDSSGSQKSQKSFKDPFNSKKNRVSSKQSTRSAANLSTLKKKEQSSNLLGLDVGVEKDKKRTMALNNSQREFFKNKLADREQKEHDAESIEIDKDMLYDREKELERLEARSNMGSRIGGIGNRSQTDK